MSVFSVSVEISRVHRWCLAIGRWHRKPGTGQKVAGHLLEEPPGLASLCFLHIGLAFSCPHLSAPVQSANCHGMIEHWVNNLNTQPPCGGLYLCLGSIWNWVVLRVNRPWPRMAHMPRLPRHSSSIMLDHVGSSDIQWHLNGSQSADPRWVTQWLNSRECDCPWQASPPWSNSC